VSSFLTAQTVALLT